MDNRKNIPYNPNMMFPEYILGCHLEAEYVMDSAGNLKIVGMALVEDESLDDVKRNINKKYGIGGLKMNKEQLFEAFKELFPDWAKRVTWYKKIGSKMLAIKFVTDKEIEGDCEEARVFLYYDPNNWQFGTKVWRKRPENRKE